jgi:ATP-dependent helicase/nuclease subunit B
LLAIGREIFAHDKGDPRVRAFWEAGFANIAAWFVEQERKRRERGVSSVAAEAQGSREIDGFTLTGKADRIEKNKDGSLCIVDYKTGGMPTNKEVESGIEPQLQLLALIAASGGFRDIEATKSSACEYWELKGGASGCKTHAFDKKLPDLIASAEEGLRKLIADFADPIRSYEVVPRPRLQPRYNDYAHLSRLMEWARTGEDS